MKFQDSISYRNKNYKIGDKIKFVLDSGGQIVTDIIRGCFIQQVIRAPYGKNSKVKAVILENHSWIKCSDIINR